MSLKSKITGVALSAVGLLAVAVVNPPLASAAHRSVTPVPALAPLTPLIGSWKCTGGTTAPDGSRQDFETTSTAQFILGGNFLRWQETNTLNGVAIASAEYVWGWDAQHSHFTVDRFDSSGQRGDQSTPGWVGNVLTSEGAIIGQDGSAIQLTTAITKTGRKSFTVRAEVDLGGGLTVVSESSCTR